MFKSRTVTEDGYYQLDFTGQGISLTKISRKEVDEIPYTHFAYISKDQYIEGTDVHNWKKLPLLWDVLDDYGFVTKQDPPKLLNHKCQIKEYHGLFQNDKYCVICGKKE